MDKKRKTFRQAMCGVLSCAMLLTNLSTSGLTAFAATDFETTATETGAEATVERTVTLGNFENGTLAFADSKKSSVDFSVGEEVTVIATPADGYEVGDVAILDESENRYSCSLGSDKTTISFTMPEYDVKVYANFTESESESLLPETHTVDEDNNVTTTAEYILANADPQYVGTGDTLVESDIVWQKITVADADMVPADVDLDILWFTFADYEEAAEDADIYSVYADAIMANGVVPVFAYELSEDSDYYVSYMDTIGISDAKLQDMAYARNNNNGEAIEGFIYDENTGLLYVPKSVRTVNDEGKVELASTQFQMLYTVSDYYNQSAELSVVVNADGVKGDVAPTGTVEVSTMDNVISIQVAEDNKANKRISEDDVTVALDGVEIDSDYYWYDEEAGTVNIITESNATSYETLEINVETQSTASVVGTWLVDTFVNPFKTYAGFDPASSQIDSMASFPADGFFIEGQPIGTTTVNVGAGGISYGAEISAVGGMFNVREGATDSGDYSGSKSCYYSMLKAICENATLMSGDFSEGGNATVGCTIPAGQYNIGTGYLKLDHDVFFPLYCAHVYVNNSFNVSSATVGAKGWKSNATGSAGVMPTSARLSIIYIGDTYAIMGIVTPTTHSQAGCGYFKINITTVPPVNPPELGDIELTKITVKKVSASPSETTTNSRYSLAGATFQLSTSNWVDYEWFVPEATLANPNPTGHWEPVDHGQKTIIKTTDSTGTCTFDIPGEATWELSEVSPSTGFYLNNDVKKIISTFDKADDGSSCTLKLTEGQLEYTIAEPVQYGSLVLTKSTDNESIVAGNNNYSVEDAVYYIVNTSDSNAPAYWGSTDSSGKISWINIPLGTYKVYENNSSQGYAVDESTGAITINCNNHSTSMQSFTSDPAKETPQTTNVGVVIEKYDTEQLKYHYSSDPQGDGTLSSNRLTSTEDNAQAYGATFHFKFFSQTNLTLDEANAGKGNVLFEFDAKTIYQNGKNVIDLSKGKSIVSSSWKSYHGAKLDDFFAGDGKFRVPYGSLYVTEVQAPTGYTLDEVYVFERDVNGDGIYDKNDSFLGANKTSLSYIWNNPDISKTSPHDDERDANLYVDMKGNLNAGYLNKVIYSEESMILGSVEVTKLDNQTETITPQGNAKLQSVFRIFNESAYPVWVDLDQDGEWAQDEEFAPGAPIADIITDEETRWCTLTGGAESYTNGILPYGTYKIVEIYTNQTYRLVPWEKTFYIRTQGQTVTYNTAAEQAPMNDVKRGTVVVQKFTTDFLQVYAEGDADLGGALFEITNQSTEAVYDPQTGKKYEVGDVVAVIETDSDGRASTMIASEHWGVPVVGGYDFLPIGTYTIREIQAPNGYLLNEDYEQTFTITYDGEVVYLDQIYDLENPDYLDAPLQACGDLVQRSAIELYKSDNDRINHLPDGDENVGQGDASLAGAVFAVVNMSKHDVLVNGQRFKHGSVCYTFVTDENGFATSELDTFPYGTYYIFEVMAPSGYFVDSSWTATVYVREHGATYTVGDYKQDPIRESVYRSGVIGNKIDAELSTAYAQGDSSLNGATIGFINRSTYSVYVNGAWYEPGEMCYTIETSESTSIDGWDGSFEDGWWQTSKSLLPYGTYEVVEVTPSEGYLLNEDYHYVLKVRKDNSFYDISTLGGTLTQQVIRGDVQVQKWDAELNASEATGGKNHGDNEYGSDMNGVQFTIKNASKNAIVYDGNKVEPGEVVCYIYSHWNDEVGAYTAETTGNALPYGTYTIQETKTNNSYLLTDGDARTFKIREDSVTVTKDADGKDLTFKNLVRRGDIEFVKIADATSARMSTVWLITNNTTGEQHVIATDRNGEFYSNSEDGFGHSVDTNANDVFIDDINNGHVINIADVNIFSGIWFSVGENGSTCEPVDERGALPFGYYTMEEVRTDSNIGYGLQTIRFYIERDSKTVNLGTITNDRISIDTIATNTTTTLNRDGYYQVTDNVSYDGLTKGVEYTLIATLMDAETMAPLYDADGNMIQSEVTFCPRYNQGTIDNVMTFKSEGIGGKTAVVYETLYYEETGDTVTSHTNIHDVDQTVRFPIIKDTTATDSDTGDHDANADGNVKITDTVEYAGLTPGTTYICVGTLMDVDTQSEALDDFGNEISSYTVFTPFESDGSVDVVFEFSGKNLAGHTIVVFEIIAVAEMTDGSTSGSGSSESGTVPETPSEGDETGDNETTEDEDSSTGGDSSDAGDTNTGDTDIDDSDNNDDNDDESTDNGESDSNSGNTGSTGSTNTGNSNQSSSKPNNGTYTDDDGNEYTKGDIIASEGDWNNPSQTIYFAKISTSATAEKTGTHEGHTGMTTIRDIVTYENLLQNEQYTLLGVLMDARTGEAVIGADGNKITASQTFIAAQKDGTVEVAFDVNGDDFAGRTLVVYETLSRNNVEVASEADIEAVEQTIYFPAIRTSATANGTTSQEALASTIKITDTVSYENVQVGQTYTVVGELRDAANGGYIYEDEESMTPVTASTTFTATETSGTVDVVFEGDATRLAGTTLVVFESLQTGEDSVEVAKHADVEDSTQYIYIPKISTSFVDSATGLNELMAAKDVTLVDTITYENLRVGQEYVIKTHVVDKSTGDDVTNYVVTRFVPEMTDGTVEVRVDIDATDLAGKSLVCFETIAPADYPDYVIASHEDINDEAQTVTIPKIATTAVSGKTGNDELVVGTDSIVDTVTYENLRVGNSYTVTGTLVNVATGEVLKDTKGDVITAQASIVPTEANGTVDVTFSNIDTSKLKNADIVCYEVLTRADITLAKHEDIKDEVQTVHVPDYSTNAVFSTGIDEAIASGEVTVNDTISYKNLRVGETYVVTGKLVTVGTAETLKVDGKEVTATATFKPETEDGTTVLTFKFNASSLAGNNYVVYSDLKRNDIVLMSDNSNSNEDETIHFPSISTELKDSATGLHEVLAGTSTTLKDTITYSNLKVGTEYVITGTLVKASDGSTITTTSVKFTPSSASGTVDVSFANVNTSAYAGTNIVAYEKFTKSDIAVAEHKDLKDAKQTVSLPSISTSAVSADTKTKMVWVDTTSAVLTDTVKYNNLVVGNTYTVTTTLMDKSTGKVAATGEYAATATTTFTAKETSGSFDVSLRINPAVFADGATLVFYESMANGSTVIAKHEDINDDAQAVHIMGIDTIATADDLRSKTINVSADAKIVDTMAYNNLVTGAKYYVHSWVMNKDTGKSIADLTTEFTPSAATGTVGITIPVDTTGYQNASLVVFEYVYDSNGKLLAVHADLNDADQTVTVKTVSIVQTGVTTYSTSIAFIAAIIAVLALIALCVVFFYRKKKVEDAKKNANK